MYWSLLNKDEVTKFLKSFSKLIRNYTGSISKPSQLFIQRLIILHFLFEKKSIVIDILRYYKHEIQALRL